MVFASNVVDGNLGRLRLLRSLQFIVFTLSPSCAGHASDSTSFISSPHRPTNSFLESRHDAPRRGPHSEKLKDDPNSHAALRGVDVRVRKVR